MNTLLVRTQAYNIIMIAAIKAVPVTATDEAPELMGAVEAGAVEDVVDEVAVDDDDEAAADEVDEVVPCDGKSAVPMVTLRTGSYSRNCVKST